MVGRRRDQINPKTKPAAGISGDSASHAGVSCGRRAFQSRFASPPFHPVGSPAVGLGHSASPTGSTGALAPYPESQNYQRYPGP